MTLALRVILAASFAIGTPATAGCNSYDFRPHATLDIGAIKKLTLAPMVDSARSTTATGAQLVVLPFDTEDHPAHGLWRSLAIVYVTRGDLGEDAVGGLLLQASRNAPLDLARAQMLKDPAGVELRLPEGRSCPAYVIRLRNDGSLIVHGQTLGRLRG